MRPSGSFLWWATAAVLGFTGFAHGQQVRPMHRQGTPPAPRVVVLRPGPEPERVSNKASHPIASPAPLSPEAIRTAVAGVGIATTKSISLDLTPPYVDLNPRKLAQAARGWLNIDDLARINAYGTPSGGNGTPYAALYNGDLELHIRAQPGNYLIDWSVSSEFPKTFSVYCSGFS